MSRAPSTTQASTIELSLSRQANCCCSSIMMFPLLNQTGSKRWWDIFANPRWASWGRSCFILIGTLQHAGVVIGIGGVAGHRSVGSPGNAPGNFGSLALAQDVSCVTGACLLIRRSVFDEVGGLDERNLQVAFNDVDLCLKVRQAGHRIIWTPFSVLYHHKSRSRGSDLQGDNLLRFRKRIRFMQEKWRGALFADPFRNPNLSFESTNHHFANPPRHQRPWMV